VSDVTAPGSELIESDVIDMKMCQIIGEQMTFFLVSPTSSS